MALVITGDDLRRRRRAKGLTQAALGALLGVTDSAVGQWETGTTKPNWRQAQKLEEIFEGVTPDESTRIDRLEARAEESDRRLDEAIELLRQLREALQPPDQ